jgi:hypothetical protein
MSKITVEPFVLKDMRVRIEEDNFEDHLSSVTFTPSASVVTWQGGTPESSHSDTTVATWTVAAESAQDWDNPKSFSRYLYDNAGKKKVMEFAPQSGVGKSTFTSEVSIQEGAIGGAVGAYATASVTMGCTRPVIGVATADDEPAEA